MQNSTAFLEDSLAVPQNLNTELPCDPAISLLGIYPKELKKDVQAKTCIPML